MPIKVARKPVRERVTSHGVANQLAAKKAEQAPLTRGIIGKCRRAHAKAGINTPTDAQLKAFARKLLAEAVPILQRSSSRIAMFLKGEAKLEDLR